MHGAKVKKVLFRFTLDYFLIKLLNLQQSQNTIASTQVQSL
jgi:hypothetical protein